MNETKQDSCASFKFCVLGSGSSGNCIHVSSATTSLLVDAGLSGREIIRRLELTGADVSGIAAVCLTHEHSDHVDGLLGLLRVIKPRLYANSETVKAVERSLERHDLPWQIFSTGFPFQVGDISIEPFSVSHDAMDPVGFCLGCAGSRIGIVTDIGVSTTLVREKLRHCHALILESNHDEKMLKDSQRPWSLKQRIAGRQGHLSNRGASELLAEIAGPALTHVYLAHISADCNRPEIACRTVSAKLAELGFGSINVLPTWAAKPSQVYEVTRHA